MTLLPSLLFINRRKMLHLFKYLGPQGSKFGLKPPQLHWQTNTTTFLKLGLWNSAWMPQIHVFEGWCKETFKKQIRFHREGCYRPPLRTQYTLWDDNPDSVMHRLGDKILMSGTNLSITFFVFHTNVKSKMCKKTHDL